MTTLNENQNRGCFYLASPDQLAERLGISRRTVQRLTATGLIPCIHIGRLIRYDADKVVAALAEQGSRDE
jgi:excisionase family DNA binding protein